MLDSFLVAQAANPSRYPRGVGIHGWAVCAAQDVSSSACLYRDHCLFPIEVGIGLELCKHFLIF
jgi:hypothetical protein